MEKNIAELIVKIIIDVIVLGWLIAIPIILVDMLIDGKVLELVIGSVICVGVVVARNLLCKEEH